MQQGSKQECMITCQFKVWKNVRDGCVRMCVLAFLFK